MTDWGKEWWKMTLVSNVIELSWLKVYYRWYSLAQDWRMGGWWYNSKGDKGDLEKKKIAWVQFESQVLKNTDMLSKQLEMQAWVSTEKLELTTECIMLRINMPMKE